MLQPPIKVKRSVMPNKGSFKTIERLETKHLIKKEHAEESFASLEVEELNAPELKQQESAAEKRRRQIYEMSTDE